MSIDSDGYDPAKDAHDSYFAAVEAKRRRGDRHWTRKPAPAWRLVSPAPRVAALDLAGAHARVRRAVLSQVRNVETVAIYRGDDCMAVVYFGRHGWRRTEMALSVAPAAAAHMGRLVRIAQLTLFAMAETHLIVARIGSGNHAGQRMAMLVGFRAHGNFEPGVWILRKGKDGRDPESGQSCAGSGGKAEGATGGGERSPAGRAARPGRQQQRHPAQPARPPAVRV